MSSKAYFDDIANDWDTIRSDFFSENVRDVALSMANVQAGETAGDIGAGSGFVSEVLLRKGLEVVAVDQSPAMLDALHARFPKAAIDTRVGESESLPIDDATLDHAFANMYLHHVENPAAAIREMVRTLKTGGKLVITDLDAHEYEFLRTEQHDRWLGFQREDVAQWFREAGLKNVRVEDIPGETCNSGSTYTQDNASITIFLAYGEK